MSSSLTDLFAECFLKMMMMIHVLLLCAPLVGGLSSVQRPVSRKAVLGGALGGLAVVAGARPAEAAPMIETKKRATYGVVEEDTPAYLSEPTAEFKKEEAERAAFRAKQKEYRNKWDAAFVAFQEAKGNEDISAALSKLSKLVAANGGLPSGLRLTDMITLCRRVKGKALQLGQWDTPTEMEYMTLVRTVKRAQNPNLSTEDTGFL